MVSKNGVIGLIGSLRERYSRFLEKELNARNIQGMVGSHGAIFNCLYENGGQMKVMDIANRIGKSKSNVTELVSKLENAGYVTKTGCCFDARCTYVTLTERGHAVKRDFDAISKKLIDKAYRGFTEEEKEILVKGLEKMWKNF